MSSVYPPRRRPAPAIDEANEAHLHALVERSTDPGALLDDLVHEAYLAAAQISVADEPPRPVRYPDSTRIEDFTEAAEHVNRAGPHAQIRVLLAAYGPEHALALVHRRLAGPESRGALSPAAPRP